MSNCSKLNKFVPGLDKVESLLVKTLQSEIAQVQKPLIYIQQSPGKRIRPSLVLLSSLLFTGGKETPYFSESDPAVEIAAAVELIHTASLIHDDIVDNAGIRRGRPALHVVLGKKKAVYIGNFLLAKAFFLLQNSNSNGVLKLMNDVVTIMCEGESEQMDKSFDLNLTEEEYSELNYKKTSNFLAACCEAGARAAGITDKKLLAFLNTYGKNLGYAFQIIDDIMDFTAHPHELGKPVGNDFKQGTITLPLIYMLQKNPLRRVFDIIGKRQAASIYGTLKKMAMRSGAIKYSLQQAYKANNTAYKALGHLPPSDYRDRLKLILDKITEGVDASLSSEITGLKLS